ncbi:hypothetical protein BC830DRAFT_1173714 [Chytriomyces sp. MP71]|nr:hypothetical protein BC830DRAFT_1173714 [Chytriomyces sp. MP71]
MDTSTAIAWSLLGLASFLLSTILLWRLQKLHLTKELETRFDMEQQAKPEMQINWRQVLRKNEALIPDKAITARAKPKLTLSVYLGDAEVEVARGSSIPRSEYQSRFLTLDSRMSDADYV